MSDESLGIPPVELSFETERLMRPIKEAVERLDREVKEKASASIGTDELIQSLIDAGILSRDTDGNLQSEIPAPPNIDYGDYPNPYDLEPSDEPPPTITGLTATAGLTSVFLKWDRPYVDQSPDLDYKEWKGYTEIWRSFTPSRGDAVLIGQVEGNSSVYTDEVGSTGTDCWYWVKMWSGWGIEGAWNSGTGVYAKTGRIGTTDFEPGRIIEAGMLAEDSVDWLEILPPQSSVSNAYQTWAAIAQYDGKINNNDFGNYFAALAIDGAFINHAAINTAHIAAGTVGSLMVQDLAVTNGYLQNLVVEDAQIAELNAQKIIANTFHGSQIIGDTITVDKVNGLWVASDFIQSGSINAGLLTTENAVITETAQIEDAIVQTLKIGNNAVTVGDSAVVTTNNGVNNDWEKMVSVYVDPPSIASGQPVYAIFTFRVEAPYMSGTSQSYNLSYRITRRDASDNILGYPIYGQYGQQCDARSVVDGNSRPGEVLNFTVIMRELPSSGFKRYWLELEANVGSTYYVRQLTAYIVLTKR